jgi:hypothetical protein
LTKKKNACFFFFRRKAVYDFKLRAEAAEPGSEKQRKIITAATNYLYRLVTDPAVFFSTQHSAS